MAIRAPAHRVDGPVFGKLAPPLGGMAALLVLTSLAAVILRLWRVRRSGRTRRSTCNCTLMKEPFSDEGWCLTPVLVVLILLSVATYLLSTCVELIAAAPHLRLIIDEMEFGTTAIFTVELLLRVWSAPDRFILFDAASLAPYYTRETAEGRPSIESLRILRLFRLMQLSSSYTGMRDFCKVVCDQLGTVMLTSGFLGATVWLLCSSMYFYFDRDNPSMIICPDCEDPDDPASCRGDLRNSCYNRMESIPNAMYFCLVNLFGEFPLMDRHSRGSRAVCAFVALVGQVLLGVPCGLLGGAFQVHAEERAEQRAMENSSLEASREGSVMGNDGPPEVSGREVQSRSPRSRRNHGVAAKLARIMDGKPDCVWESSLGPVDLGEAYASLMKALAAGSVLRFLLAPLEGLPASVKFFLHLVDCAAFLLCFAEFVIRVALDRRGLLGKPYFASAWSFIDLAAFLPAFFVARSFGGISDVPPLVADALRSVVAVARALKLERFFHGFRVFRRLAQENSDVFFATGLLAIFLWLVCSVLMYLCERDNPVEETRKYYTSVPASMWLTMLNLTGECPLCDYTLAGRWIIGLMGVVAVGFFTIPFGLMSNGFESYLEDIEDDDADEEEQEEREVGPLESAAPTDATKLLCLRLLQGSSAQAPSPAAVFFERVAVAASVLSVGQTLLRSARSPSLADSALGRTDEVLEWSTVLFFTLEFLLRFYTAPVTPGYWSRRRYLLSAAGIVDLLTIGPFYLVGFRNTEPLGGLAEFCDRHDEELRLLRVLRLGLLDHYVPSVRLLRQVFRRPSIQRQLAVASYVGATTWLLASCLLSLAERWDPDDDEQRERFSSVLAAMPFALVHLTGDYPLIDYTLVAKAVHFCMIVLMSGFVAVPAGIVANGLQKELNEAKDIEAGVIVRVLEDFFSSTSGRAVELKKGQRGKVWWMNDAGDALIDFERLGARQWVGKDDFEKLAVEDEAMPLQPNHPTPTPTALRAREFLATPGVTLFREFLTGAGVLAVLAASMPRLATSSTPHIVEVLSALGFMADYVLHFIAAPADPSFASASSPRRAFAFSAAGLVDAAAFVPFWLEQGFMLVGAPVARLDVFLMLRVLRVLRFESSLRALGLLSGIAARCKGMLVASGILTMLIWLLSAVLFYEFERGNERVNGAFESIPEALYYTAVFLAAEWAEIDFTPPGKMLMVVLCSAAIGIAAIPMGSLFEAFEDSLRDPDGS